MQYLLNEWMSLNAFVNVLIGAINLSTFEYCDSKEVSFFFFFSMGIIVMFGCVWIEMVNFSSGGGQLCFYFNFSYWNISMSLKSLFAIYINHETLNQSSPCSHSLPSGHSACLALLPFHFCDYRNGCHPWQLWIWILVIFVLIFAAFLYQTQAKK